MMMTTQTVDDATTIDHDQHHYHILNCGHCGSCSNVHDIWIYNETRDALTSIATECTKQGFYRFKNINYVKQCFQAHSQLSSDCVECWIQNVQCNWNHCFKTCIKHKAPPFKWLPSLYHRKHESPLDPCVECDERMCGPTFVTCAGANRRRVGVVSDLQRNLELEICDKVDWNYISTTMEIQQHRQNYQDTTTTSTNTFQDDEGATYTETQDEL